MSPGAPLRRTRPRVTASHISIVPWPVWFLPHVNQRAIATSLTPQEQLQRRASRSGSALIPTGGSCCPPPPPECRMIRFAHRRAACHAVAAGGWRRRGRWRRGCCWSTATAGRSRAGWTGAGSAASAAPAAWAAASTSSCPVRLHPPPSPPSLLCHAPTTHSSCMCMLMCMCLSQFFELFEPDESASWCWKTNTKALKPSAGSGRLHWLLTGRSLLAGMQGRVASG